MSVRHNILYGLRTRVSAKSETPFFSTEMTHKSDSHSFFRRLTSGFEIRFGFRVSASGPLLLLCLVQINWVHYHVTWVKITTLSVDPLVLYFSHKKRN